MGYRWVIGCFKCLAPILPVLYFNAQMIYGQADYTAVDTYASRLSLQDRDIEWLTDTLTKPFPTEQEKARAIFVWISENIAYDCGSENHLEEEPAVAIDPLYYTQLQLENIMSTRRTRCDGYAFLFRLMCRLAEINCSVVEGYARFDGKKVDPATVQPNHAWNAACLDGEWYEIDVTAGSGQCVNRRFRAERRMEYFQMSDQLLKRTYIPVYDGRRSFNQGRIIIKF